MAEQHIGSHLPVKNKVISVDESTVFLSHFDLNTNDVLRGIEANAVCTLKPKEGKFGGGVTVEEGTTNLVTNAVVTSYAPYHNVERNGHDFKMTTLVANTFLTLQFEYELIGKTVSISGYMKKNGVPFFPNSHPPSTYQPNVNVTRRYNNPNTGYFEYTCRYTASSRWVFHTSITNVVGDVITIDNFQVEEKSFITSFANGSRGDGMLSYDMNQIGITPTGDWTISGWFKRNPNQSSWSAIFGMGSYYNVGESEFHIWTNHTGSVKGYSHDNQVGRIKTLIQSPNAEELEEWFFVAVTHSQALDQYSFYIWTKDRYVKETWNLPHTNLIRPILYLGRTHGGHFFNGMIDEVRIDKTIRTEEEIMAWYYSNSPFWPKGIYKKAY